MRHLILVAGACLALCACTPAGTTSVHSAADSALSVAQSSIDAAANSFDAALYGLDFAMDAKLIVPGSAPAKQIASIGRQVQAALNKADTLLKAGNSAGAKAALDEADALVSQFKSLLPHKTTGLAAPPLMPGERSAVLARAAA
jgi:hypothetical protein